MLTPYDLNLRHLRALRLIAQHGRMRCAAGVAGLSQPALTQALAKLEHQLGTALFMRSTLGMVPTQAGERVIARVSAAFEHLSAAARSLSGGGRRGFSRPENLFTTTQLRGLLSLADAGSFVGAAQLTGLAQPALHRAVREIEELCGLPLVERRGRGVALTSSGQRLAKGCRLAVLELAAALHDLREGGALTGRLTIGAMPLCRVRLLPEAVARLSQEIAPGAKIDVVEGSYRELLEPLRDGRVDLMIGALRGQPPPDLRQRPLFADRLVVTARADHPLANQGEVTLKMLASYPWIVGTTATPSREQWERLFDSAGIARPDAPVECGSVMTTRGVLMKSDFLTLLSPDQIVMETKTGMLVQIGEPLAESLRIIGVTTRQDWQPTGLQRRFIELIAQTAGIDDVRLAGAVGKKI